MAFHRGGVHMIGVRAACATLAAASLWHACVLPADLPIGQLSLDGPSTPEQISLYLPVNGELPATALASVRFRSGAAPWMVAHPLHRIRPADTAGKPPADAFAGVITGLSPGTSYTVEVV